jgi:hypothetical protein
MGNPFDRALDDAFNLRDSGAPSAPFPPVAGGAYDLPINPKRDSIDTADDGQEFHLFNRYRARSLDDYAQTPVFYLFFTSPCLNLEEDTRSSMNFADFMYDSREGKRIMLALSFPAGTGDEKAPGRQTFMKILTNCCEGFSPSDVSTNTLQVGETRYRYKHVYMGSDADSKSAGSFNVEYVERPGLPITKLHKLWYDYAHAVRHGEIKPFDFIRKDRLIDYQVAAYFFACAPDGVTIEYWAKYTGVMPTAVPYSAFACKPGGGEPIKVTVPYSFVYKEDMEPDILGDFNDSGAAKTRLGGSWNEAILKDMGGSSRSWSDAFDTTVRGAAVGWWNWLRGNKQPNDKSYISGAQTATPELQMEERTWASPGVRVGKITTGGVERYALVFDNDDQDNKIKDFN